MSTHTLGHHSDPGAKVIFGFWIYLMTDAILFAALFATYSVLHNNTFGGPGIQQITSLHHVIVQTLIFLASVLTYGLSFVALHRVKKGQLRFWVAITFILALAFLGMQFHEYANILNMNVSWQTSAFLSAYFTLTGIFTMHVIVGLLWMIILFIQLSMQGLSATMKTRFSCFNLFWNFLNIIWILIFTLIYLMGAI